MSCYGGGIMAVGGVTMMRTTLMLPEKLKSRAKREARRLGVSLGQFIRTAVEGNLKQPKLKVDHPHPFFDDDFVIVDDGPTDVAENHDRYIDESLAKDYERQVRRRTSEEK
jgi:hypothetical protein